MVDKGGVSAGSEFMESVGMLRCEGLKTIISLQQAKAFLTISAMDLRISGFMAKAFTPSDRALASLTSSLKPVQRTTGMSGRIFKISPVNEAPFIFGIVMSVIIRS